MKKIVAIAILAAFSMAITSSCGKDKNILGATIEVTVKNWPGDNPKGYSVYMYKDKAVTNETKIADANKQVVTNDNGVATFELNFTELNILESQTTLYFAVFYKIGDKEHVAGSVGVTVKRGETKKVELTVPL